MVLKIIARVTNSMIARTRNWFEDFSIGHLPPHFGYSALFKSSLILGQSSLEAASLICL